MSLSYTVSEILGLPFIYEYEKGSQEPEYSPFVGDPSGVGLHSPTVICTQNLKCLASRVRKIGQDSKM